MVRAQIPVDLSRAERQLCEVYVRALTTYLEAPTEEGLKDALELGWKALERGVGMAELVAIHHETMVRAVLSKVPPEEREAAATIFETLCSSCPGCYFEFSEVQEAAYDEGFPAASSCRVVERLLKTNAALVRLSEMREQEAERIAHALHDEAAQLLAAVHLAVEEVARELDSPHRKRLKALRGLLDETEEHLRCLSHELRPTVLDDLGVVSALDLLAQGVSKRTSIPVVLHASLPSRLPALIETTLYRVVQECVHNCVKHARASVVTIDLEQSGQTILCRVKDDGVGFDAPKALTPNGSGSLGLIGIRERIDAVGGALSILSGAGKGTEVVVRIPLKAAPGANAVNA